MHPLSTFPTLLSYGLIGPTLLRIFVGVFLMYLGRMRWMKECKWLALVYLAVGLLIGMGLYTQISAIVGIVILYCEVWSKWQHRKSEPVAIETYLLYKLCMLILITLLFTGPGFFAFDLPL